LSNTETKEAQQQKQVQLLSGIVRAKSAVVVPRLIPSHQQQQAPQRPRTVINQLRTDDLNLQTNEATQTEAKKLSLTADNLNLKTFKEVDKIAEVINSGYTSIPPDLVREKQKDEIYRKFWHLKSTGQYHGSLLAKPKVMAPEIRE